MESKNNNEIAIVNSGTGILAKAAIEYDIISSFSVGTTILATLPGNQDGKVTGIFLYLNPASENVAAMNSVDAAIQAIINLKNELPQLPGTIKLMILLAHVLEILEGGSAPNTIPDGCQAIVNIYTQSPQSHKEILEGIEAIDIQLQEELRRFRLTVNILENTHGGINLAKLGPLADQLPVIVCAGEETKEEYQSVIKSLLLK